MSGGVTPTYDWAVKHAHIRNEYVRETMAEFFSTMLLLFFVVGSGLQSLLHPDSHIVGVFGVVFGLMVGVYVFGGVSGAHMNCGVSIGLAVAGHLKWAKLPLYIVAQIFGGYLGSLLAFGLYKEHLRYMLVGVERITGPINSLPDWDWENGGRIIGSLSPNGHGSFLGIAFAAEVIVTAILLMAIMAVIDKGNLQVQPNQIGFLLALTVAALAMTHSTVSGPMLNPARDLCPRLALASLGWSHKLCFQSINFDGEVQEWWVVGVFAPPVGAIVGVLFYNFVVGAQLTNNRDHLDGPKAKEAMGDWRDTIYIPRTGQPHPISPAPAYSPNMQHGHGAYNQGYVDDGRPYQRH